MYQTTMYFGRAIPDGGSVSAADFRTFTDEIIAPIFTAGYTVQRAVGGWCDTATGQSIREDSVLVTLIHDGAMRNLIRAVADAYKSRFRQDAVMVVTQPVEVEFI